MSDYEDDDYYNCSEDEEYLESPDTNDDDFDIPIRIEKGKQRSIQYESLSPSQVWKMMDSEVERLVSLSGLHSGVAAILCRHYRWNMDRLLEKYMDSPRAVMALIGESPSETDGDASKPAKRARTRSKTEFECGVCFVEPEAGNTFQARCRHNFCKDCYGCYIRAKIRDEGEMSIKCMSEKCNVVLTDEDVRSVMITDLETNQRYLDLVAQSFVKCNSHLRYCPHPSCTQAVSCKDVSSSSLSTVVPVVCCSTSDSHKFCFGCGMGEDHRPAICKTVGLWLTNAREDAGTTEWLKANTRACPKCKQSIEKNGGCNRILCRHCQHQFCWVCSAAWDKHGYKNTSCNAFAEPAKSDPETAAKANLERWLFYFDRWNNHEVSAKLDEKLCEMTEEKILEVQGASGLSWIQAQFMKNAVEELTRCRNTLKWTYSMAFFLKAGNSKQIFEDIQADLEKAVEDLSQMLEEEIQEETVHSLRQRMMDKTVYVAKRQEIMTDDTAKGLLEGRWEWTVPVE